MITICNWKIIYDSIKRRWVWVDQSNGFKTWRQGGDQNNERKTIDGNNYLCQGMQQADIHTRTLSLTLSHTHTHTNTHNDTHSTYLSSSVTHTHTHIHTHSNSLSLSLSLSYSLSLSDTHDTCHKNFSQLNKTIFHWTMSMTKHKRTKSWFSSNLLQKMNRLQL